MLQSSLDWVAFKCGPDGHDCKIRPLLDKALVVDKAIDLKF